MAKKKPAYTVSGRIGQKGNPEFQAVLRPYPKSDYDFISAWHDTAEAAGFDVQRQHQSKATNDD